MGLLSTIETKVWAAGAGAGAGAVLGAAADWGLGVWLWHADSSAAASADAIAAVPAPVAALVALTVTFAGAVLGGYKAPASNHAGNNATGVVADDSTAGHADLTTGDLGDGPSPAVASLPDDAEVPK